MKIQSNLFDCGDEWHFECKVLNILDEDTKETELIKSQCKSPEQYFDYDQESEDFEIMNELQ